MAAGMPGTQSPGAAPPRSPEAEEVETASPSSARKHGKQELTFSALSEEKFSQESWSTWEPSVKLISSLEKQVQEELPRG